MSIPGLDKGKQLGVFMGIMHEQPLSLALVVMNFALIAFMFYAGSSQLAQRQETTAMIVKWQQDTDRLMASCVSGEIMSLVLKALAEATTTRQPLTVPTPTPRPEMQEPTPEAK